MNRKDIWLIVWICLVAIALALLLGQKHMGNQVVITINGQEYGSYDIRENQIIDVKTDLGYNKIVIKDESVYVEDADCPDKYCMKQGVLSDGSRSLICLPHKLVVEVRNSAQSDMQVDAIAQ